MSLLTIFFRAECQTYLNSANEDEEVITGKRGSGPHSQYSHPHELKQPPNDQLHSAYQPLQVTGLAVQGPYETIKRTGKESSSGKNQSTGHRNNPRNKHTAPWECIYENN